MDTRTITDSMAVAQQSPQRTNKRVISIRGRGRMCPVFRETTGRQPGCPSAGIGKRTFAVTSRRPGQVPSKNSNPLNGKPRPWRGTEMLLRGIKLRSREPRPGGCPASATSKLLTFWRKLYATT